MSDKFFYKGKPPNKPQHGAKKYSDGKESKPGSQAYPVNVTVQTEERKLEVEALLQENNLFAVIAIDSDQPENIVELESLIQTPKTIVLDKVPGRNEVCSCGSGKKYKKCCG